MISSEIPSNLLQEALRLNRDEPPALRITAVGPSRFGTYLVYFYATGMPFAPLVLLGGCRYTVFSESDMERLRALTLRVVVNQVPMPQETP